jgi:3-deoxy-D-manno-octulosonic-acid transferase
VSRALYSLGWWLATPLVVIYLLWRSRRQPEYRAHWAQRWGFVPARTDEAPLVWVHAVSVGETRAAQPLVAALLARDPSIRILLTHMTPTGRQTGAELFASRFGGRVTQAYLPYDYRYATRRFLRAWRPTIGIVMETELWPNLCASAAAEKVPLALVNARLSEKSLRKGMRWHTLMTPALDTLCCVVAQTETDAQRIRALGRERVEVAGNMKFDVTVPAGMTALGRDWRARLGARAVVLAASTRDGEERLLLDAWHALSPAQAARGRTAHSPQADARAESPEASDRAACGAPLLAIVPRHPQRFGEVAEEIARRGLRLARRAQLDASDVQEADVLLGDSMGEMFAYYAMADVAIIGGSLLPFGGQNLIEACAAGVPVVLGEHTYNFEDAARQAIEVGAACRESDAVSALRAALALIGEPERRTLMSQRGEAFAAAHRGATRRTLALLEPWLAARG